VSHSGQFKKVRGYHVYSPVSPHSIPPWTRIVRTSKGGAKIFSVGIARSAIAYYRPLALRRLGFTAEDLIARGFQNVKQSTTNFDTVV
jgi:hypothetical protein